MTLDELLQLRGALDRSLRAGTQPVVATLVARDGHSYREPGSMMVMTETLEQIGGVSGGCLEGYIARVGRELLRNRASVLMSFDTTAEEPDKPILGCGGRLEILVELGRADHIAYLDSLIVAVRSSDSAATVITFDDAGATPSPQACRSVLVNGRVTFGPPLAAEVIEQASAAIDLRECITLRSKSLTRTAAYVWPQPRVVIFGAGDDARPLVEIAKTASWHVSVIDRRARLATADRFANADRVIATAWHRAIDQVEFTAFTAAVVMTHSVEDDLELLPPLLAAGPGYIGLLGPSTRTEKLRDVLPAESDTIVRSPIGLPLGDKSPAGIAIAIMAELTAWRRGKPIAAAARELSRDV